MGGPQLKELSQLESDGIVCNIQVIWSPGDSGALEPHNPEINIMSHESSDEFHADGFIAVNWNDQSAIVRSISVFIDCSTANGLKIEIKILPLLESPLYL